MKNNLFGEGIRCTSADSSLDIEGKGWAIYTDRERGHALVEKERGYDRKQYTETMETLENINGRIRRRVREV